MTKIFTTIFMLAFGFTTSFGQTAPDFSFTDTEGVIHTLSEALDSGKVIMLDFFFVNCPPCVNLAPEIESIIEDYEGTTLEIWAISDRDSDAAIDASIFTSTHSHHKVGGVNGGGDDVVDLYADNFNFTGFPTYAIVCSDGTITWDIWPISEGANEIRNNLTEECGVVEAAVVSTAEIQSLNGMEVYPNPAYDNVTLEFSLNQGEIIAIDLFNALGQQVKSVPAQYYNAGSEIVNIEVASLAKGFYVLRMQTEDGINSYTLDVK